MEVDSEMQHDEISHVYLRMETGKKLLKLVQDNSPKEIDAYIGPKVLQLYFPSLDGQDSHGVFMHRESGFKFVENDVVDTEDFLREGIRQFEFMDAERSARFMGR